MGMVDRLPRFSNFNRNSSETAMSRWKTVSPHSLFKRGGRPFEKGVVRFSIGVKQRDRIGGK